MKSKLTLFVVLILTCNLTAQHSVVFPIQHNVLIKGIPNYLSIGLKGIAADSIELSAHHSKLEKSNNWNWYITPDTGYTSETVTVKAWHKKKLVSVDSTEFRLRWLPDPHAYAGNSTGRDSVTKSEISTVIGLTARAWNIDQDVWYRVMSFAMRIEPYAPAHQANDPYLTNEMRAAIQASKSGDCVVFYTILVKYPDGRIKVVEDISVIVK